MKKTTFLGLVSIFALGTSGIKAQGVPTESSKQWLTDLSNQSVITTTVPMLLIDPDARSGGMADVGAAITPDANAMAWNPAKLAFEPNDLAVSVSYTPWLRELVPDISLSYLSMAKKIDNLSGWGASLKYFSLGDINFTDGSGNPIKTYRPNEFSLDGGYSRKLSDHFSIGIAGRFIYSDLSGDLTLSSGEETKPAVDFSGDISGYYSTKIKINGNPADLAFGADISNIGGKISYTTADQASFIPTNLRVGGYLNMHIDEYNDLGFALDFNKLLVPTPPVYQKASGGGDSIVGGVPVVQYGLSNNVGVIQGMVQSFYDAPGGITEQLAEINPSLGIEYWYAHQVAGRVGFFYESPLMGDRQYLTFGVGLRYTVFNIDFAYLVPTNGNTTVTRSPLENTLRFTLSFNFDKGKVKKASPSAN